jgi:hypothetical protein
MSEICVSKKDLLNYKTKHGSFGYDRLNAESECIICLESALECQIGFLICKYKQKEDVAESINYHPICDQCIYSHATSKSGHQCVLKCPCSPENPPTYQSDDINRFLFCCQHGKERDSFEIGHVKVSVEPTKQNIGKSYSRVMEQLLDTFKIRAVFDKSLKLSNPLTVEDEDSNEAYEAETEAEVFTSVWTPLTRRMINDPTMNFSIFLPFYSIIYASNISRLVYRGMISEPGSEGNFCIVYIFWIQFVNFFLFLAKIIRDLYWSTLNEFVANMTTLEFVNNIDYIETEIVKRVIASISQPLGDDGWIEIFSLNCFIKSLFWVSVFDLEPS